MQHKIFDPKTTAEQIWIRDTKSTSDAIWNYNETIRVDIKQRGDKPSLVIVQDYYSAG